MHATGLPFSFCRAHRFERFDGVSAPKLRWETPKHSQREPGFFITHTEPSVFAVMVEYEQGKYEPPRNQKKWLRKMIKRFATEDMSVYWDEIHVPPPPSRCELPECPHVSHRPVSHARPTLIRGKPVEEFIQESGCKSSRRIIMNAFNQAKRDPIHGVRVYCAEARLIFADGSMVLEGDVDFDLLEQSGQSKIKIPKSCAGCCQVFPKLKKCANCDIVYYCSPECQRVHWPQHKTQCALFK